MKEQKRFTSAEIRELADQLEKDGTGYAVCQFDEYEDEWRPLWQSPSSFTLALMQGADAEEELANSKHAYAELMKLYAATNKENAKLKERLDAIVKVVENILPADNTDVRSIQVYMDELMKILSSARGEEEKK